MNKNANFSSKTWCSECRRYIVDPSEEGIESDGVCPHYGWAILKPEVIENLDGEIAQSLEADALMARKKGKPIFGQGGGIVDQSAVRFSRDTDEADGNDSDIHGQKDAGMLGMLAGVLLGLCAVVAFFMFSPQSESSKEMSVRRPVPDLEKPSGKVVRTRDDVVNFINEFSRVEGVDKLLGKIRLPAVIEPSLRKWCEVHGMDFSNMEGLSVISYSEEFRFGVRLAAVTLGRAGGRSLGVVYVEIPDDGEMRMDWEILVGAAERYWSEFVDEKPGFPVPLWVSMHRTSIIGVPLPDGEDADDWIALKVMSPAFGASERGHLTLVKKGNAFGDYIENSIPWNTDAPNGWVMAVRAHFTDDLIPMLMIDELRYPGGVRSPTDEEVYPLASWGES